MYEGSPIKIEMVWWDADTRTRLAWVKTREPDSPWRTPNGLGLAQSPEEQVKAANQAVLAAGLKGDAEGVGRLLADDLWWIRSTGVLLSKPQFVATINPGIGQSRRTFTEESVAVHGQMAVLVCRSDFMVQGEPRAERVLRVFCQPRRQVVAAEPCGFAPRAVAPGQRPRLNTRLQPTAAGAILRRHG